MKILISRLTSSDYAVGGAEYSAYLHYSVLGKLGYDVDFYTNARFNGIKSSYIPSLKVLRWIWVLIHLPIKALVGGYDVLNPHSREDQIALTLTKWLHRTPVVWKDPGDLIHNIKLDRIGLLGGINQRLLVKAIEKADAIYMLNDQDKSTVLDRLQKLGNKVNTQKFYIVPSDILFADYDLKAKPIKKTNRIVIGTICTLHDHKGVQYLLQSARILNKDRDNLEFWVVGDGPYRQELESIASGMENVVFWGQQSDISPYLVGMDIFVTAAEFEGWGRNVKEAMYFSKPVVGSAVGGIAQQIENGKTGLLFEPKNVGELTKHLDNLIQDEKLRIMLGENAHTKAVKDGDYVDLIRNKILPIFKSVVSKPSS